MNLFDTENYTKLDKMDFLEKLGYKCRNVIVDDSRNFDVYYSHIAYYPDDKDIPNISIVKESTGEMIVTKGIERSDKYNIDKVFEREFKECCLNMVSSFKSTK